MLSRDLDKAKKQFSLILDLLPQYGLLANESKIQEPALEQKILGFIVNSADLVMKVNPIKIVQLNSLVNHLVYEGPIKRIAVIVGKLINMNMASRVNLKCFLAKSF